MVADPLALQDVSDQLAASSSDSDALLAMAVKKYPANRRGFWHGTTMAHVASPSGTSSSNFSTSSRCVKPEGKATNTESGDGKYF